jgi:hypothetical protein
LSLNDAVKEGVMGWTNLFKCSAGKFQRKGKKGDDKMDHEGK